MAPSHLALTDVLLGSSPPVSAGEEIPATFTDANGHPQPVDFERLVQIGAAEKTGQRDAPEDVPPDAPSDVPSDVPVDAPEDAPKTPPKRTRSRKASA